MHRVMMWTIMLLTLVTTTMNALPHHVYFCRYLDIVTVFVRAEVAHELAR